MSEHQYYEFVAIDGSHRGKLRAAVRMPGDDYVLSMLDDAITATPHQCKALAQVQGA